MKKIFTKGQLLWKESGLSEFKVYKGYLVDGSTTFGQAEWVMWVEQIPTYSIWTEDLSKIVSSGYRAYRFHLILSSKGLIAVPEWVLHFDKAPFQSLPHYLV